MDTSRITSDPATASSRIYVGGLNGEISHVSMEEYFEKYGKVVAISMFRGYGFVQFANDEGAQNALKDGGSKLLRGFKLMLKTAVKNKAPPISKDMGPHRPPMPMPPFHDDGPPDMKRPRGPPRRRGPGDEGGWSPPGGRGPRRYDDDDMPPERFRDRDDGFDFDPYHRYRGGGPPGYDEGRHRDGGPGGRHGGPRDHGGPRGHGDHGGPRGHGDHGGPRGHGDHGGPSGAPPAYMPQMRSAAVEDERANDCEIVVLDRKNRPYAEEVEDRLKNIGLAVDILFPRAGAPINQVLDQIVSRGTLYAVVVHPTNEQHRSVSLNIMHGNPPQEHRNMPLDDAMSLVARNFEAYMLSNKDKAPPQGIINLLNFVRENRPLTAVEYNRLIRYLEEKRNHQLKPEKSSLSSLTPSIASIAPKPVPAPAPVVSVATPSQQQMDLQQKILSMMQAYKTQHTTTMAVGTAPVTVPVPAPVLAPGVQTWQTDQAAAAGTAPGMARVNSAIDSLVTSGPNLLKMEQDSRQQQQQQQQQQYGGGYGYGAQTSSLGQAPANPLFGAYANQRY